MIDPRFVVYQCEDEFAAGSASRDAEVAALRAEVAELKEANERFGLRQEWWNERMFTLEQERDRLRELLREAREELTLWTYHGHGSKTSGFGSATLCNKIDAALGGEKP